MTRARASWPILLAAGGVAAAVVLWRPQPDTREAHAAEISGAPATLALLVGIKEYADAGDDTPPPLLGPENDVDRAAKLLTARFGFDPAGIKTVIGPQATHEAIVRTFRTHLIEHAGPDTRVVFWFSGHGSRVPDASRKDGSPRDDGEVFDETFIAWDSRAVDGKGGYDVTDDELFSLLSALRSKDVVVITDSCHSGGVLRGGPGPGVRECRPGTAPLLRDRVAEFWPADVTLLDDDALADFPPHVVQIAACAADQEAGEIQTDIGTFGTLTWFLTKVLHEFDKGESWGRVAATVRAQVASQGTRPGQNVLVVGDAGRALFGGRGRDVPRGWFQVDPFGPPGSGRLLVGAGSLHGIGEGAELRLADLDGNEAGTAVVYRVGTTSCNAKWQGQQKPPGMALRAWPKTIGDQRRRLCVLPAEGVDASLLSGLDVAVTAGSGEEADYVLRAQGGELGLWDRQGECVRTMQPDRGAVQQQLTKEFLFRSLWEGVAEPGRFQVEIAVEPVGPAEAAAKGFQPALVQALAPQGAGFAGALVGAPELTETAGGGLVRLRVTNKNDQDLHVAIVSACENREVNVVFGADVNNVVRAGDAKEKIVWLGPGKDWPKKGRPMLDRYVVVATARYADFRPFESKATVVRTRGATQESLPPFLQEALGGPRRGGDMDEPAWGIGLCDLQLVTPEAFEAARRR